MRRPTIALLSLGLGLGGCPADQVGKGSVELPPDVRGAREAFFEAPSAETLLGLLDRSHSDIRDAVGPHVLTYEAHFVVEPQRAPKGPSPVGEPSTVAFDITDTLELRWASEGQFVLRQSNEHERRREFVLVDERAYTRRHGPQWYVRPIDGQVHELWLDDAYQAVHDAIELTAPNLSFNKPAESDGTVHLTLTRHEHSDAGLRPTHPRARWRAQTTIDDIAGELTLAAATGAWLTCDLKVSYRFSDRHQRPLRGHLEIHATLEPSEVTVSAPADAKSAPERDRYTVERRELLHGLAAP